MATSRAFIVPETKSLPTGVGEEKTEVSLRRFIQLVVDTDPRFTANLAGVRAAVRIDAVLAAAKPGEEAVITEEDWELLKSVLESPKNGYPIRPVREVADFIEAIVKESQAK